MSGSVKWDLFAEIKNPYDVEQLARSLIPDHEGSDRSWRGYARTFFSAVTRQAHAAGVTDMAELYRLLVVADSRRIAHPGRRAPPRSRFSEAAQQPHVRLDSIGGELGGRTPSNTSRSKSGPGFSVRAWVADRRPGVLFMPYKAGQIAALRSTISAWMRLAIFEAMDARTAEPATETESAGSRADSGSWSMSSMRWGRSTD